jgi:hypothetical protein
MRDIFDLRVKENRVFRRNHPLVWAAAYNYMLWRSEPYNLSREEALEEVHISSSIPPKTMDKLADAVERLLNAKNAS